MNCWRFVRQKGALFLVIFGATQAALVSGCATSATTHDGAQNPALSNGSVPRTFIPRSNSGSQESIRFTVGFATNQLGEPESSCNRSLCRGLLAQIEAASRTIDFAIYGVRAQPQIVFALIQAQARGVRLRGIVDAEDKLCTRFAYPETQSLVSALTRGSITCDSGKGVRHIMHNKFFVFDGAKVWTGSTNVSDTELGGEYSSDVAALFESQTLAAVYSTEFDEMFGGHFHRDKRDNTEHEFALASDAGPIVIRSYFSPTDHAIENAVLPLIDQSRERLDIAMFFMTHAKIRRALFAAQARGVKVRVILDAGGAASAYSIHRALCAQGVAVKIENWGGKSHSKWAIADAHLPGKSAVVFGSMNFTAAGDEYNDENTLYVKNDAFASAFAKEFERQWSLLAALPTCLNMAAEGALSSRCTEPQSCHVGCLGGSCCDGIDNDHDGLTDLSEEACGCADGIDNDRDGYIDRRDFDCDDIVQ